MGVAKANPVAGECQAELDAVALAVQNGVFLGKRASNDQSNLLAKLEDAVSKVQLGKFADAVLKLMDISDTANALAGAPKPKLEDAGEINAAVADAVNCLNAL